MAGTNTNIWQTSRQPQLQRSIQQVGSVTAPASTRIPIVCQPPVLSHPGTCPAGRPAYKLRQALHHHSTGESLQRDRQSEEWTENQNKEVEKQRRWWEGKGKSTVANAWHSNLSPVAGILGKAHSANRQQGNWGGFSQLPPASSTNSGE